MSLNDLVEKVDTLDENLWVLNLNNNFRIACENKEGELEHRIFIDEMCTWGFSDEAKDKLEDYTKDFSNPLKNIKRDVQKIYDEILEQVKIEPIRKREYDAIFYPLIGTLGLPLFVPLAYSYAKFKKITNDTSRHDWLPLMIALSQPFYLKSAVKELIYPSIKGVKISNKEALLTNVKGENYVGVKYGAFEKEFPDFFHCKTLDNKIKPSLSLVFPDGIIVDNDSASYKFSEDFVGRGDKGNYYEKIKYFLPIKPGTKEEIERLVKDKSFLDKGYRGFRKNFDKKEVKEYCKSINLI